MNCNSDISLKYNCNICNKFYASTNSLWNHNNKFHKNKDDDTKLIINNLTTRVNDLNIIVNDLTTNVNDTKIIRCKYCNNFYKHKQSKFKHEQKCKLKNIQLISENNELIELKKEHKEIENTISELKKLILQHTKITSKSLLKNNNTIIVEDIPIYIKNTNTIINSNNNSINSNNNEFINFTQNLITFNDKYIKFCYYNEQVYMKAKNIAKILEYEDIASAIINNIDIEDKFKINKNLEDVLEITTIPLSFYDTIKNEDFKTIFINESGLYNLISLSKNTEANKFKKWITSEVLPSIRKYSIINNYIEVDLDKYYGIDCVYVIHIKDDIYKYGNTSHLFKRLQSHKTNFNYKKIIKIYEMKNINDAKKLEKRIMNLTKSLNINIIYNLGNTNHKEIFKVNNNELDSVIKKIDNFTLDIDNKNEKQSLEDLESENMIKFKIEEEKTKQCIIENKNLKLKLEILKYS